MTSRSLLQRWTHTKDPEAFRELVARFAPMLLATSKRILGNEFEAEEITQECFELLAQGRRRPKTHVGPWLHAVATNRCLDRLRSSRRRLRRERAYVEGQEKTIHADSHSDLYDHIDAALAALPQRFRAPVVAHFLEGRSHQDIANELNVSRQTVTYRIGKGIQRVRSTLRRRGIVASATVLGAFLQKQASARVHVSATLDATLGKLAVAGPLGMHAGATGLLAALSPPPILVGAGVIISLMVGAVVVLGSGENSDQVPPLLIAFPQPDSRTNDSDAPTSEANGPETPPNLVATSAASVETKDLSIQLARRNDTAVALPNGASVSGVVLLPTGFPYIEASVIIAPLESHSLHRATRKAFSTSRGLKRGLMA